MKRNKLLSFPLPLPSLLPLPARSLPRKCASVTSARSSTSLREYRAARAASDVGVEASGAAASASPSPVWAKGGRGGEAQASSCSCCAGIEGGGAAVGV